MYHTFLSSLVKEATAIHLPCDSLPRQGRRPLFSPKSLASHKSRQMDLIHVQGSQIRNGAGEDALKRGMDEVRANINANPYTLATLHRGEILLDERRKDDCICHRYSFTISELSTLVEFTAVIPELGHLATRSFQSRNGFLYSG